MGRPRTGITFIGALTLKPSAYHFRPWEVLPTRVANYLEGGHLLFHRRGTRVVRITGPGWLSDRVRFAYDGFRRQRLTTPVVHGRVAGWPVGLTRWLTLVSARPAFTFAVDPGGVFFWWWWRVYIAVADGRNPTTPVAVDVNTTGVVYHGAFGLPGVVHAGVALPGCTPYEEDASVIPPVGSAPAAVAAVVPQLWAPTVGYTHRGVGSTTGVPIRTPALFQVSPLQRLLPGW